MGGRIELGNGVSGGGTPSTNSTRSGGKSLPSECKVFAVLRVEFDLSTSPVSDSMKVSVSTCMAETDYKRQSVTNLSKPEV